MNKLSFILISLFCLSCSQYQPSFEEAVLNEDLVQIDDMIVEKNWLVDESELSSKSFSLKQVRLWPNGIIYYRFSSEITANERSQFLFWCKEMGEFANVKCQEKGANNKDYVFISKTSENVCGSSYVGRWGGEQPLKFRCWNRRTVHHELLHAFGIHHEHNRHDRDNYLTMLLENADPALIRFFQKVRLETVGMYLNMYDYDSVMHYESRAGSKNGKPVFYRTDLGPVRGLIKLKAGMSYGDHYGLYALYGGTQPKR